MELLWNYNCITIELQRNYHCITIEFVDLKDLEIYNLAREISDEAWVIYKSLNWQDKKIIGDQFISAIDSIGANIAEGFGRYHYLDKNKFNYNARGSLFECIHWLELLKKRGKITDNQFNSLNEKLKNLAVKLNNYIQSTKNQIKLKGRKYDSNSVEIQ